MSAIGTVGHRWGEGSGPQRHMAVVTKSERNENLQESAAGFLEKKCEGMRGGRARNGGVGGKGFIKRVQVGRYRDINGRG